MNIRHGIAFAVVTSAVAAAAIGIFDWAYRTVHLAREIHLQNNGGEAYPYVIADKADLADGKDRIRLWLGAHGGEVYDLSIWISPAAANRDAHDPLYWSIGKKWGSRLVYENPVLIDADLEPGDYFIEMSAKNGTVVERLTIGDGIQMVRLSRGNISLDWRIPGL